MLLEEVDRLLEPGYLAMETGYSRLPNGQMHIAVLTRMPGCKGKWIDWLFHSGQNGLKARNELNKNDLLFSRNIKKKLKNYIVRNLFGKSIIEGKLLKYRAEFEDPSLIFDPVKLSNAGVSSVTSVKSYRPDGTLQGRIVHVVRDTDYGCEMRSRFWFDSDTEEDARIKMEHYISEHSYLADSLKKLIEEWQQLDRGALVSCKFCHSNEVVKNGLRRNTQYWLCKNCGRGFVDNKSLPKMKYSFDIVGKAVFDYCGGKSLREIRRGIEEKYNLFPSNSTILGWVHKITNAAREENKALQHSGDKKA
jgi:transposase-like protein